MEIVLKNHFRFELQSKKTTKQFRVVCADKTFPIANSGYKKEVPNPRQISDLKGIADCRNLKQVSNKLGTQDLAAYAGTHVLANVREYTGETASTFKSRSYGTKFPV